MNIVIFKRKSLDYVFFVVNNGKICVFYIQNDYLNLPRVVNNQLKNDSFFVCFSLFYTTSKISVLLYIKFCLCFIQKVNSSIFLINTFCRKSGLVFEVMEVNSRNSLNYVLLIWVLSRARGVQDFRTRTRLIKIVRPGPATSLHA
jgi:hypothetical protein